MISRSIHSGMPVIGGPCDELGFCGSLEHGWLAATVSTKSQHRELLAVCVHFTSSGHSLRDSSDFVFSSWPLRRVWRLHSAANWCAFLRDSRHGGWRGGN